jgi:uncharacterized radical SAM superfamily protein
MKAPTLYCSHCGRDIRSIFISEFEGNLLLRFHYDCKEKRDESITSSGGRKTHNNTSKAV